MVSDFISVVQEASNPKNTQVLKPQVPPEVIPSMQINVDFTQPALVHPQQHQWVASPQAGVERIMLDRTGAERGRATSIVRYAPDSRFPHHQHPAGEEILVLSGVFSEGDHHYPQGWYLRNPAGSGHAPHSAEGAVIFVKLGHLPPAPNAPRWRVAAHQHP